MRLTLRTLLAYMDDRLPPAGAREIGLKIAQSPFAAELLDRIRDVKRRRRVATASPDKPLVDANLIAEYLDDQLSVDLVQRIEQQILASDQLLAEVASAHELLGLLRDPIELESGLRDRLYALAPPTNTDLLPTAEKSPNQPPTHTTAPWHPDSHPAKPLRFRPAAAAAVLATIWILALVTDSSLFQNSGSSKQPQTAATSAEGDRSQPNAAANDKTKSPETAAIAKTDTASNTQPDTTAPAPPQPPQTPPQTPAETAIDTTLPPATMPVAAAEKTVTPPDSPDPQAAPNMPPEQPAKTDLTPAPKALYIQSDSRVVLVADQQRALWTNLLQIEGGDAVVPTLNAVNARTLLHNNWFAIPGTFVLKIRGEGQAWQATTSGPGLFRAPDDSADLQILSGQLLITADEKNAWPQDNPPVFTLQTGAEIASVTLLSEQTLVAVETRPTAAPGTPANVPASETDSTVTPALQSFLLPLDADLQVRLTLLDGSAQIQLSGTTEPVTLAAPETLSWLIVGGTERSKLQRNALAPAAIPAWMLQSQTTPIPEVQAVQSRVLDALSAPGIPGELVRPLLADKNPQTGLAAAEILCVTADTSLLLAALFDELDESVHRRILDGLRSAVISSSLARQSVAAALETRLSMMEAAFALQLVSGLNDVSAHDRLVAGKLLQYMQSDSLALRTLAIHEMERLTGSRQNYFPNADASRRRDAVNRWQKTIERNGGTLLP